MRPMAPPSEVSTRVARSLDGRPEALHLAAARDDPAGAAQDDGGQRGQRR